MRQYRAQVAARPALRGPSIYLETAWQSRPDGLPDLMLDSMDQGVVELRVRGEAGATGKRARRLPMVPKQSVEIKRYVARHRPELVWKFERLLAAMCHENGVTVQRYV